jgi:transposase-like protein
MRCRGKPFPAEVCERAVRMVLDHEGDCDSQWVAIASILEGFGMTPETLRKWVRRAEIDADAGPGPT